MNVVFYASEGKRFDEALAAAFVRGVVVAGDRCERRVMLDFTTPDPAVDVAVMAGVKGKSKLCFDAHLAAGKHAIILDKGYTRDRGGVSGSKYIRVSVDAFQPHAYFRRERRPPDRWLRLDTPIFPMMLRTEGTVLFAGSSQKYCNWHGLGDATEYARDVLKDLSRQTKSELVYRPKPSWRDAVPIRGYRYSSPEIGFAEELSAARIVVTFGSNAAFEALVRGVPALVLGDGIARPLARTRLDQVNDPLYPSPVEVAQLAYAVAYCQWTEDEFASGLAWGDLRAAILGGHTRSKRKDR